MALLLRLQGLLMVKIKVTINLSFLSVLVELDCSQDKVIDEKPGIVKLLTIVPVTPGLLTSELNKPIAELRAVEADYVVRYRGRRRGSWRRWGRLLYQLSLYAIFAALLMALPDFALDALHTWKNPIVVFVLICCIGKLLLDTLFYEHYQP